MLIHKKLSTLTDVTRYLFYELTYAYERWALIVNDEEISAILRIASLLTGLEVPLVPRQLKSLIGFVKVPSDDPEKATNTIFKRVKGEFDIHLADSSMVSDLFSENGFLTRPLKILVIDSDSEQELLYHITWFEKEVFGIESFSGLSSLIWRMENESQAAVLFGSSPDQQESKVQDHKWGERSVG